MLICKYCKAFDCMNIYGGANLYYSIFRVQFGQNVEGNWINALFYDQNVKERKYQKIR